MHDTTAGVGEPVHNVLGQRPGQAVDEAAVSAERLRVLLADHALLNLPNVIVTPHIAYDTREAVGRIIETTLDNIVRFGAGSPRNVVD